jgi:protein arginine kinase activator
MCGVIATVHLTQIIQGKVSKIHYCEACANKGGAGDPSFFELQKLAEATVLKPAIICPVCKFTDIDFRKSGRLGCPSCWDIFAAPLDQLLNSVQHDSQHMGRVPAGEPSLNQIRKRLISAQTEMEQAIKSENYEKAAQLRDEITKLKTQIPSE